MLKMPKESLQCIPRRELEGKEHCDGRNSLSTHENLRK